MLREKANVVAPRPGDAKEAIRISTRVWLGVGTTSYLTCAFGLWSTFINGNSVAHEQNLARLHAEVPGQYLEWPMSAFAAVLVLNVLNLALRQNTTKFRTNLLLLFINGVAFTTDLLINLDLTPVFQAANGRMFHPLRYLQWSHSTPTLIYMIWLSSDPEEVEAPQLMYAVANDVVMILTGLASTCSSGSMQLLWGAISFATFFAVLITVSKMFRSNIDNLEDSEARGIVRAVLFLMLGLWNLFPVVWLLAELRMISPAMEHLCWGLCDYAAKAVFVSQLWQSNIASVYERREIALRMWEESNRVLVIDKLQRLVDAKEQLLNVISHELRTPVLGIMALSGSLVKDVQQKVPINVNHLCMMKSSAAFLNNLINASIETAKNKDQKPQAAHEAVYMYELVEEVCTLIRPLVREGVTLTNAIPSELPPVVGDRTRLMQVLFNLVGNASRFTMHGHIHVRARILDNYIEISVEDTGIGVAQEDIEAIFQPYVTLTSGVASSCGGTGLGLYLVKLALDGHNADVNVESEVGKGSAFHFSLPMASEELIARCPKPPLPPRYPSRHGSRPDSRNASKRSLQASPQTGVQVPSGLLEGAELLQEAQARLHGPESVSSPSPGEPGVAKTVIQSRVPVNAPSFPPVVNGTGVAKPSSEAAVAAKATLKAVAESMKDSSEEAINSWGAQAAKPLHRHIHGSYQVMIVDDDVISQVVAEQVVRSQKWKAMKASSGEQCIEYLKHAEVLPDLLLLDNKMPGPTGFLVCQKLRATYPHSQLAIIMVSVRVEEGDAVQALQNGADDYVAKPYKRSELTARIMAQLRVRDNMASAAAAAPAAAKGANVVVGPRKPAPGSSGKRGEEEGSRLRLHHQGTERAGLPMTQPPPRALMFNNAMVVVLKLLGLEQRLPLLHATTSSPAPTSLLSLRAPGNSQAPSGPAVDATGHLPTSAGFGGMGVSSQESEPGWPLGMSSALQQAETAASACSTMQQLLHHMHCSPIASAYMQLSATSAAVVVPMGTERQPAVATGGTLKSEQDLHDSIHATDPRHNVFGLAASLLRLVSQAQWPDGTPMQAHCVMHECAAKLMPLPCQQQQQQQWNSQATGGAECVLPMLPASEVLLGLGARGFPGCIVATQSAYELLSGTVKFVPWLRSLELPMHPQDVKAGSTASSVSAASGGVGAVPASGSSMVCMGGGPQHLTQAQLYVADAPGLTCAAALSHAEALRAQAAEQQQQQQHAHAQLLQPQPQQQQQQQHAHAQQQQQQQHPHAQQVQPQPQQQQQQLQQPQQWQQMDAQQQKALQRVQQQRIKGRRLSIGPILYGIGAQSPSGLSPTGTSTPPFPMPSTQSPLTSPQPSQATIPQAEPLAGKHTAGLSPAPSDVQLSQRTKRTSDSHLWTSPTAGNAAQTSAPSSVTASTVYTEATTGSLYPGDARTANTAPTTGNLFPPAHAHGSAPTGGAVGGLDGQISWQQCNSEMAGGVVGGVGGRSSTPQAFGAGGALAAPVFGAMAVPLQPQQQEQQQQLAYMQAAGHMSSSAVELEVLRARCKELESENCSLQHRLVDAHASRSSIATERDIFKRMTADVRAQWQHAASVSGSPALGTSPGNSGQLILLPESTATLHSQPLPSLHLSQPFSTVQGPRSDPQLQQQLKQLRGEAAAMRQEMAAALPFAARHEGIPNTQMAGRPASDTTSPALAVASLSPTSSSPVGSPPNCAAAASPPTPLFSSRRRLSLLNLGSTHAGLGGNSGGAGGPVCGRMGRNQMGLRGRSISALQPSTGGLSNPGTPPPASPAPGRAVMGGPEAPPQGATRASDIGAGAPGQNHAADAAAVTVASQALSLSLPMKRYSSMPNLVRLVEEPGEGSHADGDSGDGNAHLHTAISSCRDGAPDGTLAVQAHQTRSHTAPGPALPSAPHVTPRFRARTSSSVPSEFGTGHGSTATTSVPHSISAKSTPDVAGTISGTATRSQDSSICKVARAPSNEEGAGVASRESSWGVWPPSSGPLGVADFKAVSAIAEDHPRFPGQAPGMAGLRSESVGSAGLEAGAGTLGSATGQSSRSMTRAGGAGGTHGTGIGSSGVLPDACGSNSNSGSLPKAPMAMALGGRSERYMPAAGARSGVAGLGASSTGTATHTRSRSPLARGTSISQLPTGLGKSASVQEQASHSADPAADSPVHKLKQLFKQRKSNKGGLSRSNTAGNF